MVAKEVQISKPSRSDYGLAKRYRVISLLKDLGKVAEKMVSDLISRFLEERGTLHPGHFGSWRRRSSVEVANLVSMVEYAWRKMIAGSLSMDVAAAFPSVARDSLL